MTSPRYTVKDSNSSDSDLDYLSAVYRIEEWFEDSAEWATGSATPGEHQIVRDAIASVRQPIDSGQLSDLQHYADEICSAIAEAREVRDFAGHGNYYVSAADRAGISLTVISDD